MEEQELEQNNDETNHKQQNKFKKRKKKFLANAKGFGKMGNFGRGTKLDDEEWSYFINIMDAIKGGFESIDEKFTMANNVFDSTIDKEIYTSSNQIACTVLEHLLPFTNAENFERFQKVFADNFRPVCSDKFASHILQKLVEISFLRGVSKLQVNATTTNDNIDQKPKKRKIEISDEKTINLTEQFSDEHRNVCCKFVEKTSKFLLNNLEDFVWDMYASHIIRTCFCSLSGTYVYKTKDYISSDTTKTNKNLCNKDNPLIVPDEWIDILKEYASRLQAWPQFPEFPYDELSSGLLQNLCLALKRTDKSALKHFGKRILNDRMRDGEDEELSKLFTMECSIRLLETLLESAGTKLFTQLFVVLFQGRLIKLSEMASANFAVQKLLDNVKEKTEFEIIFDELSPNIENLLRIGYTGVVNALGQACLRVCAKQGAFLQSLQTALHYPANNDAKADKLILAILKLKPIEMVAEDKSNFIHLHGSLILQTLLQFNKPIKLVQCLLDTEASVLADLFCNPKGSHIADAYLKSKTIGEKSREKLIRHLNGQYLDMAISKCGSRAVECLFEVSNENQKAHIVKELANKINQLNSTPFGRLLNYRFRVETYRLSPATWKNSFNKETKIQHLFKGIIND